MATEWQPIDSVPLNMRVKLKSNKHPEVGIYEGVLSWKIGSTIGSWLSVDLTCGIVTPTHWRKP
jgi:hypothetical protein